MSRDDWFRNVIWTPEIEASFFRRLARSRTAGAKAQYLRLQALALSATGERRLIEAALVLLDLLVTDYPSDIQLASAHLQRAICLAALGRDEDAIAAFKASLDAERAFPTVGTGAWLEYGWFVAERGLTRCLPEVWSVLAEFEGAYPSLFPVQIYKLHGLRAVILAEQGELDAARREARVALDAAARGDSGLPHHPALGLVRESGRRTDSRIREIAKGYVDA
jgi:tetratricopeptide (TPR) repeat protein